jgi:hypothetical protein
MTTIWAVEEDEEDEEAPVAPEALDVLDAPPVLSPTARFT